MRNAVERKQFQVLLRHWAFGAGVHVFVSMLFVLQLQLSLGCDKHDGAAGALTLAVLVDLVLTLFVAAIFVKRNRKHDRAAVWAGWAASLLSAALLVGLGFVYIGTLPTGCPV